MSEILAGFLTRWSERVTTWLARAAAAALAVMMLLTFFDVIGRRVFNNPIVGTVEVTELLMGLLIFLGIGYTTFHRGHIRVDVVITYLPRRVQAVLEVIALAISIAFSAAMSRQLWLKAADTFQVGDLTQIWGIPVWPVAYVMAACSITLITGLALHFRRALLVLTLGDRSS
ncbi:MAG: TRAP transporter small permease [bacterium]